MATTHHMRNRAQHRATWVPAHTMRDTRCPGHEAWPPRTPCLQKRWHSPQWGSARVSTPRCGQAPTPSSPLQLPGVDS